ncbi:hypothetical protein [Pantoea sp. R13S299]|uniref:hypothetical protein n=1 Tax=Pantoea sp. R13S299 TaxID=3402751 RepID=UPI003ADAD5CF
MMTFYALRVQIALKVQNHFRKPLKQVVLDTSAKAFLLQQFALVVRYAIPDYKGRKAAFIMVFQTIKS